MRKFIVFLAIFALIFAFTAEAFADASLYGSARFRTYRNDADKEYVNSANPAGFDDEDTEWRMGHLTRFGVNFQEGDIKGKFEMDARAGGAGATGNIEGDSGASRLGNMRLRLLWGEWNFGAGKLMVGQNYPLFDAPISGVAYYSGGLQKFGGIGYDVARTSQLRLTFGNLRIAFMPPDTAVEGSTAPTNAGFNSDTDTTLPKIEARYDLKLDPVSMSFIGGYQSYDIVNGTDQDKDVTSYVFGFRAKAGFGAFYINATASYRQNGGNYGVWTVVRENAQWNTAGTDVEDTTAFGFGAAVGFKISDMFTVEASYMAVKSEDDRTGGDYEDTAQGFGFLCKITPAPGVVIQPELTIDDRDTQTNAGVETEQGQNTIFGVWWMISFK